MVGAAGAALRTLAHLPRDRDHSSRIRALRRDWARPYHAEGCAIPGQDDEAGRIHGSRPCSSCLPSPPVRPRRLLSSAPIVLLTEGQGARAPARRPWGGRARPPRRRHRGPRHRRPCRRDRRGRDALATRDARLASTTRRASRRWEGSCVSSRLPPSSKGGSGSSPVDGIPRLLGPLLAQRAEWRPASRTLLIGSVAVPRVGVNTFVSGDLVRVVLDATEKIPFRVVRAGREGARLDPPGRRGGGVSTGALHRGHRGLGAVPGEDATTSSP